MRDELMQRMRAAGSLPVDFYPSFVRDDDPTSGFAVAIGPKRFSTEYWAARNRIAVLVETHSWKDYPTRVRITRNSIVAMMEMAARDGRKWQQGAQAADERAARVGGTSVALTYENTPHVRTIEFRGYEYTREPSAVSGALLTRYNPKKPQIWRIPLADEVRPAVTVTAPRGGYIVPAGYAQVVGEKLAVHGIEFRKLASASAVDAEVFRATNVKYCAGDVRGPHGHDCGRSMDARAARRARGLAVRADRAGALAPVDDAARAEGSGLAAQLGILQHRIRARRNTWSSTSPRTWRSRC